MAVVESGLVSLKCHCSDDDITSPRLVSSSKTSVVQTVLLTMTFRKRSVCGLGLFHGPSSKSGNGIVAKTTQTGPSPCSHCEVSWIPGVFQGYKENVLRTNPIDEGCAVHVARCKKQLKLGYVPTAKRSRFQGAFRAAGGMCCAPTPQMGGVQKAPGLNSSSGGAGCLCVGVSVHILIHMVMHMCPLMLAHMPVHMPMHMPVHVLV